MLRDTDGKFTIVWLKAKFKGKLRKKKTNKTHFIFIVL